MIHGLLRLLPLPRTLTVWRCFLCRSPHGSTVSTNLLSTCTPMPVPTACNGSDDLPLDFTSQTNTASGQTEIVAPDLNVAVIARPLPTPDQQESPPLNTGFLVRAVLLDPSIEGGDILLLAQAPSGERLSYPLDLFSKPGGDATFVLPRRFAGGTIRVFSASSPSGRMLSLLPAGNASAELHMRAPISATAGSTIPVVLTLSDADGISLPGTPLLPGGVFRGLPPLDPSTGRPRSCSRPQALLLRLCKRRLNLVCGIYCLSRLLRTELHVPLRRCACFPMFGCNFRLPLTCKQAVASTSRCVCTIPVL